MVLWYKTTTFRSPACACPMEERETVKISHWHSNFILAYLSCFLNPAGLRLIFKWGVINWNYNVYSVSAYRGVNCMGWAGMVLYFVVVTQTAIILSERLYFRVSAFALRVLRRDKTIQRSSLPRNLFTDWNISRKLYSSGGGPFIFSKYVLCTTH
jgi:hypothetical protein